MSFAAVRSPPASPVLRTPCGSMSNTLTSFSAASRFKRVAKGSVSSGSDYGNPNKKQLASRILLFIDAHGGRTRELEEDFTTETQRTRRLPKI
jgi:hypothetical protein